jgi:signal transduction histidine kinase
VDVEVPDDGALLSCDPLLLTTALDNLVRNAMEATVAAKDLGQLTEPRVRVRARLDAEAAVVTVEDNGGGPPRGQDGQLFEPFRTSKPRGIGLGLAMTRQALEHQGGQLAFERLPDGSRFLLHLPRTPRP